MNAEAELKKALMEAAKWDTQMTEHERSKVPYSEARELVVDRIVEKYKDKIIKK